MPEPLLTQRATIRSWSPRARTVTFPLRAEDLSLLDEQYRRIVEPGAFEIRIGASSDDIRLRDTLSVSGLLRVIETLKL